MTTQTQDEILAKAKQSFSSYAFLEFNTCGGFPRYGFSYAGSVQRDLYAHRNNFQHLFSQLDGARRAEFDAWCEMAWPDPMKAATKATRGDGA